MHSFTGRAKGGPRPGIDQRPLESERDRVRVLHLVLYCPFRLPNDFSPPTSALRTHTHTHTHTRAFARFSRYMHILHVHSLSLASFSFSLLRAAVVSTQELRLATVEPRAIGHAYHPLEYRAEPRPA